MKEEKVQRRPNPEFIENWAKEMRATGEDVPKDGFEDWVRKRAERDLWFFSRWILDNDWLSLGDFHRKEVCPYLTDFQGGRFKLLMLPMGCLKTTVASRSMPLHLLIQPAGQNIYFPHTLGRNARILLIGESEEMAMKNLLVSRDHLEQNRKLRWLWPEVCWPTPKDARRWKDTMIQVPRTGVYAEPSIAAIGVKTSFVGSYYDMIIGDDMATLEAAQNPPLMERAKKMRRTAKTRLSDKKRGIFIGVCTAWGMDDISVEWQKDTDFQVVVRSMLERDKVSGKEIPLWPEKYPLDWIEKTRKSMNPIEWTLWYMNQPVPIGYTALRWSDVREYTTMVEGDPDHPVEVLDFDDMPDLDGPITMRRDRILKNISFRLGKPLYNENTMHARTKPAQGMDKDYFEHMRGKYPEKIPQEEGL